MQEASMVALDCGPAVSFGGGLALPRNGSVPIHGAHRGSMVALDCGPAVSLESLKPEACPLPPREVQGCSKSGTRSYRTTGG